MSSVGAEWVQDGALVQKRKVGLVASRWSSGTALGGLSLELLDRSSGTFTGSVGASDESWAPSMLPIL